MESPHGLEEDEKLSRDLCATTQVWLERWMELLSPYNRIQSIEEESFGLVDEQGKDQVN